MSLSGSDMNLTNTDPTEQLVSLDDLKASMPSTIHSRAVSFGPASVLKDTARYVDSVPFPSQTSGIESTLLFQTQNGPYGIRHSTPSGISTYQPSSMPQTPVLSSIQAQSTGFSESKYRYAQRPITQTVDSGYATTTPVTSYGHTNLRSINQHSAVTSQFVGSAIGSPSGVNEISQLSQYKHLANKDLTLGSNALCNASNPEPDYLPIRNTGTHYTNPAFSQPSSNNWFPQVDPHPQPRYEELSVRNRMIEPETFDGTSTTDWSDYIVHFEQIADWNHWSNTQKAKMLTIKVRGEAQKFVGGLTPSQYNDYSVLKYLLSQRFNPQEREIAYRCEFRNRRRNKGESPSDYGYALRRLGQKAFPTLSFPAIEIQIIDQFVAGLGSMEIQKHVQFHHPQTLESAINFAMEYTAVVGNLDRVTKPNLTETESARVAKHVNFESCDATSSLRPLEIKPSFTLQDLEQSIEQIVAKQFEKLMAQRQGTPPNSEPGLRNRNRNAQTERGGSPYRKRNPSPYKSPSANEAESRSIFCDYCKRKGHIETRCYQKQNDEARKAQQALN